MALTLAGVPIKKGGVQAAMDYIVSAHAGRSAPPPSKCGCGHRAPAAMAFTLYNAPQSTCSQRVRFVLHAKGLPFEENKLDLLAGDQLAPDYLRLNPNGVVPTLVHDGEVVIDSSVIIEYLDEIAPEPERFTPMNPGERARMRALMRFIDEMPAAAVRVPTFNLAFLPRFAKMTEDEFVAFAEFQALASRIHAGDGTQGLSGGRNAGGARPAAPHLRAHGEHDRGERRSVPARRAADACRCRRDAGPCAHR